MSRSGKTGLIDYPASAERNAGSGGRLGRFSRYYHKLHMRLVKGPDYVEAAKGDAANTVEIVDAPADPSLRVNAEGEIDPRHPAVREARAAVDASFHTQPNPQPSIEDIMGRAA